MAMYMRLEEKKPRSRPFACGGCTRGSHRGPTLMEISIADEGGRRFWIEQFGHSKSVGWSIFIEYFEDFCKDQDSFVVPKALRIEQILRYTIDRDADSERRDVVTAEEWDTYLRRFGPLELLLRKACSSCFSADGQLLPWFHGRISRQEAKQLLARGQPGAYLVRFSETNPHNFSLTYLDHDANGGPPRSKHVLLYNLGPPGFALSPHAPQHESFPSLRELVEVHSVWSRPCPSALATQFAEEMRRLEEKRVASSGDMGALVQPGEEGSGMGGPDDDDSSEESSDSSDAYSPNRTDYSNSQASTPANGALSDDGDAKEREAGGEENGMLSPEAGAFEGVRPDELIPPLSALLLQQRISSLDDSASQLNRAMMAVASGKHAEALRIVEEVLADCAGRGNSLQELELRARAAQVKATVLDEMGKPTQACHFFELAAVDALRVAHLAPAEADIADYFPTLRYLHHQLATHYIQVQGYDQAVDHYEQFVGYTEDVQERRILLSEFEKMAREHDFWHRVSALVVDSELEEGVAMYKGGNLEEAADRFQRVVQLARLTSLDRKKEGRALGNLATVSREMAMRPGAKDQRDMLHEAIFYYRMSCKIFKSHGDRQMERKMLNGLSLCCMDAERYSDAKRFCEMLLTLTVREDNISLVRNRLAAINYRCQADAAAEEGKAGESSG